MKIIKTKNLPEPNGHYSHCLEHNGLLFISGQLPKNWETGNFEEGIKNQTLTVLRNIEKILIEAGSNKNKMLQVRIYITDIKYWDIVNSIYAEFFGEHKPARTIVPVSELHFGVLIEADAIAFI